MIGLGRRLAGQPSALGTCCHINTAELSSLPNRRTFVLATAHIQESSAEEKKKKKKVK